MVLDAFRLRIKDLGIIEAGAAVLARNSDLVDMLNGAVSLVKCDDRPRSLGRAVRAHRETTLMPRQLQAVERIVSRSAWGSAAFADLDLDQRRLRSAAMRLLTEAAALDLPLDAWIRATARALRDVVAGLVDVPACRAGDVLRSAAGQDQVVAGDTNPVRRLDEGAAIRRRGLALRYRGGDC